jgi:hypothetical protein
MKRRPVHHKKRVFKSEVLTFLTFLSINLLQVLLQS